MSPSSRPVLLSIELSKSLKLDWVRCYGLTSRRMPDQSCLDPTVGVEPTFHLLLQVGSPIESRTECDCDQQPLIKAMPHIQV